MALVPEHLKQPISVSRVEGPAEACVCSGLGLGKKYEIWIGKALGNIMCVDALDLGVLVAPLAKW